jgi:D-alanine-D-alanine ligase
MSNKNLNGGRKANSMPICLGPISDLEEYVKEDWWNKIFNAYYLKTDGDVVEDEKITSQEIDYFIELLGIKSDDSILDLCCGQGRHTIELAKRGFQNAEGLDRSRYLIRKGRGIAKKNNINCRFREGDARNLPYKADSFNTILLLGNSFGYFESISDDLKVLKEVHRTLKPWGKLFIDLTDGEFLKTNFQPRSWEWIDKELFVCRERSLSLDKQRLISREVITHVNKGVLVDQFYAERLYSEKKIADLLKSAGFSDITFHGTIKPESQRDQDLGMMERRILVSTIVKKEWTTTRSRIKPGTRKVTVIFGDPNKPDLLNH